MAESIVQKNQSPTSSIESSPSTLSQTTTNPADSVATSPWFPFGHRSTSLLLSAKSLSAAVWQAHLAQPQMNTEPPPILEMETANLDTFQGWDDVPWNDDTAISPILADGEEWARAWEDDYNTDTDLKERTDLLQESPSKPLVSSNEPTNTTNGTNKTMDKLLGMDLGSSHDINGAQSTASSKLINGSITTDSNQGDILDEPAIESNMITFDYPDDQGSFSIHLESEIVYAELDDDSILNSNNDTSNDVNHDNADTLLHSSLAVGVKEQERNDAQHQETYIVSSLQDQERLDESSLFAMFEGCDSLTSLYQHILKLQAERDAYQLQVIEIENDYRTRLQQLEKERQTCNQDEHVQNSVSHCEQLQMRIHELEQQINNQTSSANNRENQLQAQLQQAQDEITFLDAQLIAHDELKRQLSELKQQKQDAFQERSILEQELIQTGAELDQVRLEHELAKQQCTQLQRQVDDLRTILDQQQNQLQESQEAKITAEMDAITQAARGDHLLYSSNKSETTIRDYQQQIKKMEEALKIKETESKRCILVLEKQLEVASQQQTLDSLRADKYCQELEHAKQSLDSNMLVISSLETRLQEATAKANAETGLLATNINLAKQLQEATAQIASLQSNHQKEAATTITIQTRLSELTLKSDGLEQQLKTSQATQREEAVVAATISALETQLQETTTVNAELLGYLDEAASTIETLTTRLKSSSLSAENAALATATLQTQLQDALSTIERLENRLQQSKEAHDQLHDATTKIVSLEETIEKVSAFISTVDDRVQKTTTAHAIDKQLLMIANENVKRLQMLYDNCQLELDKVTATHQQVQMDLEQRVREQTQQLAEVMTENSRLTNCLRDNETYLREATELAEDLEHRVSVLMQSQVNADSLVAEAKQMAQDAQTDLKLIQTVLVGEQEENQRLQRQISLSHESFQNLQEENKNLKQRLSDLSKICAIAQAKEQELTQQINQIEEKNEQIQEDCSYMEEKLTQAQLGQTELASELQQAQEEIDRLTKELVFLQGNHTELVQELLELQQGRSQLESDLAEMDDQLAQLRSVICEKDTITAQLQKQTAQSASELERKTQEIVDMQAISLQLDQEVLQLQQQISFLKSQLSENTQELAKLRESADQADWLRQELSSTRNDYSRATEAIRSLDSQLAIAKRTLTEQTADFQSQTQQYLHQIQQNTKSLQDELAAAHQATEAARNEVTSLQQRAASEKQLKEQLKRTHLDELAELQSQCQVLDELYRSNQDEVERVRGELIKVGERQNLIVTHSTQTDALPDPEQRYEEGLAAGMNQAQTSFILREKELVQRFVREKAVYQAELRLLAQQDKQNALSQLRLELESRFASSPIDHSACQRERERLVQQHNIAMDNLRQECLATLQQMKAEALRSNTSATPRSSVANSATRPLSASSFSNPSHLSTARSPRVRADQLWKQFDLLSETAAPSTFSFPAATPNKR